MSLYKQITVICLLCFSFISIASASSTSNTTTAVGPNGGHVQHSLAMHGQSKYGEHFTQLDYANKDAPKGGHIKRAVTGSFDNLNNLTIHGNKAAGLEHMHDQLMQRVWDEAFTLYPLVAEKIEIAPDRSWIIYHLNPNARFHDGTKMTSADVAFSFEAYKTHGHPVRRRVYSFVDKVSILSETSIRFDFNKDKYDAETALILSLMHVLPKHYWEDKDISKTTLDAPLGSGPYKISKTETGRSISYERVTDYWAKDLAVNIGHYNFDKITYQYYRDDAIALEAFKAGEYDIRSERDIAKWQQAYIHPDIENGLIIKGQFTHQRPEPIKSIIFNTRKEIFKDRKLRQAFSYAFDFETLNKTLYNQSYKRIDSFFVNSELAAPKEVTSPEAALLAPYQDKLTGKGINGHFALPKTNGTGTKGHRPNLRKAMELMKEAGYQIQDGKAVSPNGTPVILEILLANAEDEKIALFYQQSLKKLGVTLNIRTVDQSQFTGRLDDFDYDLVIFRWINSLSPGNEQMNYWGSEAAMINGSRNYTGVAEKMIDEIAMKIGAATTRQDLITATHALDRILMSEYYTIPLYYVGADLIAYRQNFGHPDKTPIYGNVFETWWQKN